MTRRSFISGDDQGGMNRRDFISGAASVPLVASVPFTTKEIIGWTYRNAETNAKLFTTSMCPQDLVSACQHYSKFIAEPVYAT